MRRLQCPYHAWCYGFDGSLKSAPHTEEIENFDAAGPQPRPHGGAPRPPVRRRLRHRRPARRPPRRPHAAPRALPPRRARARARAITYEVEANWKAIVENYSECLHCPGVHPELNRLSHYESGDEYERRRRLVRRLDDAQRGRRDDGAERRPRPPPRDPRPRPRRSSATSSTSRSSPTCSSRCTPTT